MLLSVRKFLYCVTVLSEIRQEIRLIFLNGTEPVLNRILVQIGHIGTTLKFHC